MKRVFSLIRADRSGVFAMPDGFSVEQLETVFVDGEEAEFIVVKDGTEVSVPSAKEFSNVTGMFN